MSLGQPLRQDERVIADVARRVEQPCNGFFVETMCARCLPSQHADPHGQRECVERNLLGPGCGADYVSSAVEQQQKVFVGSKKASAPRPNADECVFLATIQHDDILESAAVEAASSEPDRYAGDDLLLIARLQRVDAGIRLGLEANVLEAPPARREQTQRIERAKRRGKHGGDDPRTSDLTTAPRGIPQGQDITILNPMMVLPRNGNRDYFGARVVENNRQDVKPDQQKPV